MNENVKSFLEAEETAAKLVETLKQLHIEATSYQSATKDLDTVREHLLQLIDAIENLTDGTNEVIKILQKIGGQEIIDKLESLNTISTKAYAQLLEDIEKLKGTVNNGLVKLKEISVEGFTQQSGEIENIKMEILNGLVKLKDVSTEGFAQQYKNIENLKNEAATKLAKLDYNLVEGFTQQSGKIENLEVEIVNALVDLKNLSTNGFTQQSKSIKNLRILIITILAGCIMLIIIGIFALFFK